MKNKKYNYRRNNHKQYLPRIKVFSFKISAFLIITVYRAIAIVNPYSKKAKLIPSIYPKIYRENGNSNRVVFVKMIPSILFFLA